MAKEKQEKKKPGIVKRIFKWLGLGLLSLLLIAALIFQAPWKVTALFVVILLACTILPKAYRKWFWLSVAAVVIGLIIWVFLPEEDEGWQPYKYNFDKELAAMEADRAIPDEQNAATIYNKLLENYKEYEFFSNLPLDEQLKLPMREPWLSKDHPELAKWLQRHQATITTLIRASKKDKCQFPIYDPSKTEEKIVRLSVMRHWAMLLVTAASNDIAHNRADEALEKYFTILQMGKHERQQQSILNMLVGIAIEALANAQLERFIITEDITGKYLDIIEESLVAIKHDWTSDWPRFLEHEKLVAKNTLAKFYEVNPKGKIRLSRDPLAEMRASMRKQLGEKPINKKELQEIRDALGFYAYPSFWQKKLIKARTMLSWLFLPCNPQTAVKIIDKIYDKYYAMAKPDVDWDKMYEKLDLKFRLNYRYTIAYSAGILDESYKRIHEIYHRVMAGQKGCRLLIALRRYKNKNGNWPESLADVKTLAPAEIFVDPINGSSFTYKLTEENFELYSKGKNNIDEGGERDSDTGADDWLIWPIRRKSCRTEEKKTDAE